MANGRTATPNRRNTPLRAGSVLAETPDGKLVQWFLARRDERAERAFAELVRRHGPMVLGVCRQLLGNRHDAEDAFQATFLVFVRKARSLRQPERLGPWLHGVAVRVARKAKRLNERRRTYETREASMRDAAAVGDASGCGTGMVRREAIEALHEEVARLPEIYRLPLVLCDLGGLTHREAARRLQWPAGSLSVRLMRARKLLHGRLTRRGVAPAVALLVTATAARTAWAAVPTALARRTVRAGLSVARGVPIAAAASHTAASVTGHVLASMARAQLVAVGAGAVGLILTVVLGLIAIFFWQRELAVGGPRANDSTEARAGSPIRITRTDPAGAGASAVSGAALSRKAARVDAHALPRRSPASHTDAPRASARPDGTSANHTPLAGPAGVDAEMHVRLALGCEARGEDRDRLEHLALAVLANPGHAAARGLLGQVLYQGRWRRPDAIADAARGDTGLAAALDAYHAKRAKAPATADAQYKLALWCEQEGLKSEAIAHLVATTRLAPDHDAAWKRLGRKRSNGRWLTEPQIAAVRADARAQRDGNHRWNPRLIKWRGWLADKDKRDEAERALAEVTDPYAVQSVWDVFAAGAFPDHDRAVQLFGQIDAPAATWALGALAVASPSSGVREAACEILARRDARAAIRLLVDLLRDPLPHPDTMLYCFEFLPAGALAVGSPGVSVVETRGARFVRFYTVDETRTWANQVRTGLLFAPYDPTYVGRIAFQNARQARELVQAVSQADQAATRDVLTVVASVNDVNSAIIRALRNITGNEQRVTWKAWKQWWAEDKGYAYDPTEDRNPPDPTFFEAKPTFVSSAHFSCFAKGTPVRTLTGPRPIEAIRPGDRVLTQNTATGALGFEPVLAIYHSAPAATVRIDFDDTSIVATGIHRFWKAGHGWVMARDLKPGDAVRTVSGVARVTGVSANLVRPVFNLEVHEAHSFFVGQSAALVHDNSLVEPVVHPFDRPASAADSDTL